MKVQFYNSFTFGAILNLLIPGWGHIFWKEYLFGLFIFLIMLITSILFFVSFLVKIPLLAKVVMFGLPMVFYFFSFFDLFRTIKTRRSKSKKATIAVVIFILIGIGYQIFAPIAVGNFTLNNFPEIFTLSNNGYNPVYSRGDLLKASRLAYSIDIAGFDERVIHTFPKRYDFIRYIYNGEPQVGWVVGLPEEEIQIADGEVLSTDYAIFDEMPPGFSLYGDWPLTSVGPYSILVVNSNIGSIEQVHEISLSDVIGKVERLF